MAVIRGVIGFLLAASMLPVGAQPNDEFEGLPKEIRAYALEIRQRCKEAFPEAVFDPMQGIESLSLNDGSKIILVDNERLCQGANAGVNCSNRGCDMLIYKEITKGDYIKIFHEHLYRKYVAIDYSDYNHPRFQLMIASLYAGDKRCKPKPGKDYTSGMSCNLVATYRNGRWNWELIP